MYTVYVLVSRKDGRRYIGYTSDFEKRLRQHNAGSTKSTCFRRPFVHLYSELYATREEAKEREKYFKTGRGREELNKLLAKRKLNIDAEPQDASVSDL